MFVAAYLLDRNIWCDIVEFVQLPPPVVEAFSDLSIDTSERPFRCPVCPADFPRPDVRDKHVIRFHPSEDADRSTSATTGFALQERSRMACDQCRRGKLKCDNHLEPCHTCRRKQITCTRSVPRRRSGRPRRRQLPDGTASPLGANPSSKYRDITSYATWMPDIGDNLAVSTAQDLATPDGGVPSVDWDGTACLSSNLAETTVLEEEMHVFIQTADTAPDAIPNSNVALANDGFSGAHEPPMGLKDVDFDLVDKLWHLPMVNVSIHSLCSNFAYCIHRTYRRGSTTLTNPRLQWSRTTFPSKTMGAPRQKALHLLTKRLP